MTSTKSHAIVASATVIMTAFSHPSTGGEPPPATVIPAAANPFAMDLFGQLRNQPGNLFFSPYSIHVALTMTGAGASGNTADQMTRVLRLPAINAAVHADYAAMIKVLNPAQATPYKLSTANALFAQREHPFLPDYLRLARDQYAAGTFNVDFQTRTEAARNQINYWVGKQTHNKIPELFAPGALNNMTRMVLVNAIYFKGDWADAFPKTATRNEPFHLDDQTSADAPMMRLEKRFVYRDTPEWQAVELPYKGNALSMWVILPRARTGLAALEPKINAEFIKQLADQPVRRQVRVELPRFKMTQQFALADTLRAMGMTDAFEPDKANFTGMSVSPELYLQAVVHKAFVDVNEEGTEAAAATGVTVGVTSMPMVEEPVVFRADHPFLFLIRHSPTGLILFWGRLADPRS